MGDENFTPATGGFLLKASDDGDWESVGYIGDDGISLSDGDEELEVWAGRLVELSNKPVAIAVRPYWWSLNRFFKLATGRYKYTVPRLRRWNKGHGRSRNAGRNRHPRH